MVVFLCLARKYLAVFQLLHIRIAVEVYKTNKQMVNQGGLLA